MLKDLREHFVVFGFEEIELRYKDRDENGKRKIESDIIYDIDTVTKGKFKIRITREGPEIVISPTTDYDSTVFKEFRKIFDSLKENGVLISPILLLEEKETYPFPESPDTPPRLPPSAEKISNEFYFNLILLRYF